MRIPNNKSHGLYSCPTQLLKYSSNVVSSMLADIINLSISFGTYPTKLKMAKIIPIFKAEDNTNVNNYRLISLMSNLNRIFEKLVYSRLESFIEQNKILSPSQYGFRKAHSTQRAILEIVSTIQKKMDKRLFSRGVFIDLKTAFDTVDHKILLPKLEHYGFRGVIKNGSRLTWMVELKLRSYISKTQNTTCSVPPGSVLGPLLFLIYTQRYPRIL